MSRRLDGNAIAGQKKSAKAGDDGKWTVQLDPLPASSEPAIMTITGSTTRALQDVLVGEVWMCSGQSNMGFSVGGDWKAEVESLASNHPNLRLISVPQVGTQELKKDFRGARATLTFDHAGGGLRTVDTRELRGFAICGEGRKWTWAQAKIAGPDRVEVWAESVPNPVAVRYAWAENPVCNVLAKNGLPMTPFRTDDFPMITKPQS